MASVMNTVFRTSVNMLPAFATGATGLAIGALSTLKVRGEAPVTQVVPPVNAIADGVRSLAVGLKDGSVAVVTALTPEWYSNQTTVGKIAVLGVAGLASLKLYELGGLTFVQRTTMRLLPGIKWIKNKLGKIQVVPAAEVRTYRTQMESKREGSEESIMTRPKYQAQIGYMKDNELHVIGCAVRVHGNFLVGPDHVLGGDDTVEKFAKGPQGLISLKGRDRIILATDFAAIQLTLNDFSVAGLSEAKLCSIKEAGDFASIVGSEGKGTTGNLHHDPNLFGRLVYLGTTLAGYSGAAYAVGNCVAGFHTTGGQVNGGYSSRYIWSMLREYVHEKVESSENWLQGMFDYGHTIVWTEHSDPSMVQVRVAGDYTIIDREVMDKAFGADKWRNNATLKKKYAASYNDLESSDIAGEAQSSKTPGVSSLLQNSQATHAVKKPNHKKKSAQSSDPLSQIAAQIELLKSQISSGLQPVETQKTTA